MTQFLYSLLDNSSLPAVTAFILGLLTAISPCPLMTNITAVGYICRDMGSPRRVFSQGLAYSAGRTMAYSALGAILVFIIKQGTDDYEIQQLVNEWGELILGPALICIGAFMLFGHLLHFPRFGFSGIADGNSFRSLTGAFSLGILFALSFCPSSALFFFGMLIPLSAESTAGYLLPVVFAVATSLPVIIAAWLIAFSVHNLAPFMGRVQVFQKHFSTLIGILFVCVGIYQSLTIFL